MKCRPNRRPTPHATANALLKPRRPSTTALTDQLFLQTEAPAYVEVGTDTITEVNFYKNAAASAAETALDKRAETFRAVVSGFGLNCGSALLGVEATYIEAVN